jgi:hypothetical protein
MSIPSAPVGLSAYAHRVVLSGGCGLQLGPRRWDIFSRTIEARRSPKEVTMVFGDKVLTRVALPGRPAGIVGQVTEIGLRFVMVLFRHGRVGYYLPHQLRPVLLGQPQYLSALPD